MKKLTLLLIILAPALLIVLHVLFRDTGRRVASNQMVSVEFNKCQITILTADGQKRSIGTQASLGGTETNCVKNPLFKISPSGKYLVFEDVSGGVDLLIRVYSIDTDKIDTLAVWGTSSLLDMEFVGDKIALLSGYPEIPNEQWLKVLDLPLLYSDYPKKVGPYGYFVTSPAERQLPIKAVEGDYFDLTQDSKDLYLYGGSKDNPQVRGSFPLSGI